MIMVSSKLLCLLYLLMTCSSLPIFNNNVEVPKIVSSEPEIVKNVTVSNGTSLRNTISPGLTVNHYSVRLEPDFESGTFHGTVLIRISPSQNIVEDDINFHVENLDVHTVEYDQTFSDDFREHYGFGVDDGELTIWDLDISMAILRITYTGNLNPSLGLYMGSYNDGHYLGMNLHPTNARRVFPCIDEATETPEIKFEVANVEFNNLISTSAAEADDQNVFRTLRGPPQKWALIGHDFTSYNVPVSNVQLAGRPGLNQQENMASLAINSFFNSLIEWTTVEYVVNNNEELEKDMHIIALPDVDIEWHSRSIIGIWEPYVFMENTHSVRQKQVALTKIAEAMARSWFGFFIYAENWVHQWIITGLQAYAAHEAVKAFDQGNEDVIDHDTIFVTHVLQESLYRDGYRSAQVLKPGDSMYDDNAIRLHTNGLIKYKAPVFMSQLRLALREETDFVHVAARILLNGRFMDTVNTLQFRDALTSQWNDLDGNLIPDFGDFMWPYIEQRGCPLLTVNFQNGVVLISRSTFSNSGEPSGVNFFIPISFTTSVNPDFENVFPSRVYHEPTTIDLSVQLDDEDWVLFNIQGRGYYRVQYNLDMWERILEALEDPERRSVIHPLNRATLLDDSLNLARRITSGLDYSIAFRIVMTMELEMDYAVWKAFLRNMNFLRKRLEAMIDDDEDLDPDIYLRMVRRTIPTVENELSFRPDINTNEPDMVKLTRGMVMDHACRAGYNPCIAAAIDWFYGDSNDEVNPDIPHDLKPAVYCAMVREGNGEVRQMLFDLLEDSNTRTMYDRVVILESMACSRDDGFINGYLAETIADDSPYSVEERSRIFKAIAESSYSNAKAALNFMRFNTNQIRQRYGGSTKFEELIFVIADNIADGDMASDFEAWINYNFNNLDESEDAAWMALDIVREDMEWLDRHLGGVYDWIDENDAATTAFSVLLLCLTALITLFS